MMGDLKRIVDEKVARFRAAVSLEPHDIVPIAGMSDFWPVGFSKKYDMQQAFYSQDVTAEAYREVFSEYNQWDAFNPLLLSLGPVLDAVGSRRYTIPGREISPDAEFQHPDLTLMGPEEYGKLIDNPLKFHVEEIIPRLCRRIGSNDSYEAAKAWTKATLYFGQSLAKSKAYVSVWANEYGIPPLFQGQSMYVPIDWIADKLRGFHLGIMDIKERCSEVQAACEALIPFVFNSCASTAPAVGDYPMIFNPQHVSPFISPKDYEKVYWPSYKKLVDLFVERGYKVWSLIENNQEHHLERLQDLPKGKVVAHFETTDLAKAKKMLGGRVCIAGGMPGVLLTRGTPEQVREQTRSVLKLFEDEPGFIMTSGTTVPSNARPENLRAWLEATREYGRLGGVTPNVPDTKASAVGVKLDAPGLYARWEDVRPDFGRIEGDEKVIKETWDQLEDLFVPFVYWLSK